MEPVDTRHVIELDTLNFNRLVLDPGRIAMVDFYSPGCHLCITSMWMTDSMAQRFGDRALIGKVDVERNDTLWKQHQVNELPMFIFFKNGVEVARRLLWEIETEGAGIDTLCFLMTEILAGREVASFPELSARAEGR
ncbi:MAG: hypothetical protein JW768_00045 [Chitinispirillaceae bacterium]|nr:hypothetical protein [Chitinispirillaceae bacterium]